MKWKRKKVDAARWCIFFPTIIQSIIGK